MRTTLELDEKLLDEVVKLSGAKTKKRAVASAMEAYVRMKRRQELLAMIGSGAHGMNLKELEQLRDEG